MFVDASAFPSTQFAAMPQIDVEWAPTSAPLDAPVWTSLASRVHQLSTQRGRSTELEQYQAGKLSLVCDSVDRLLDPSYTGGPWAGAVFPNRQIRVQARWAGVTYDVINAFADGWPQAYEMNTTKVAIEATDGFKVLAATTLASAYEIELRKDQPTHWWSFAEALGSTTAVDNGFGTQSNGTYRFGSVLANRSIRLGNPGSAEFSQDNFDGSTGLGPGMVATAATACPASTTKWSIEFWGSWPGADHTQDVTITFGEAVDNFAPYSGNWCGIWSDVNTNPCYMRFWVNTGATAHLVTVTNHVMCDGNPHHVVCTYDGSIPQMKIYWDAAAQSGSAPASFAPTKTYFNVGCSEDGSVYGGGTGAYNSDVAVYDGVVLSATQVLAHYNAGANAFSGEDTGSRANRILNETAWPAARRTISTGVVNVGIHDWSDRTALDYLQTLAQTERAEFYMESDGTVMWRNRNALTTDSRSTVSQATFGDSASETYHYSEIVTDYNEVQIRNDVTITRDGGTPQRATDTTSIEKYLRHSHTETGTFDETDATALTKAAAILARYKDPKLRVTSIKILPGNDPTNLYPQVLGRKIGDRITVVRRPQGVGTAISQDCWIEGIEHDVTPDVWSTTFRLVACS